MPKLPALWAAGKNPTASIVQKQYVDTRLEELELSREPRRQGALKILEAMLLAKLPPGKKAPKIPAKQLLRIYNAIEQNLQTADLTVNFKCETWFAEPNPYDTYTQMYQRAMEGKRMVLRDTEQNQADVRAKADNLVSFPKTWQTAAQPPPRRGLGPGRQTPARIQKQMDTGAMVPIHKPGELAAWLAGNPQFNPNTKQAFLALNYGRRPHGSAINYGYSHFVLKRGLKPRCLYYAQDSFLLAKKKGVDASVQVAFNNLGVILEANDSKDLREAIYESCYEGRALDDGVRSLCKYYLLEAHHFGDLSFHEHVEHMVISPKGLDNPALWPKIAVNAHAFCQRNGIALFQTD